MNAVKAREVLEKLGAETKVTPGIGSWLTNTVGGTLSNLGTGLRDAVVGVGPARQAALDQIAKTKLEHAHNSANADILGYGLGALGVGAGLRGLQGLMAVNTEPKQYDFGPTQLDLPYPVKKDPREKVAEEPVISGPPVESKHGLPHYLPMLAGGVLLGGVGGYMGMDALLASRAEAARKAKVEQAKNEFNQALLSSYDKPVPASSVPQFGLKQAQTAATMEKLGAALDRLYDLVESGFIKSAENPPVQVPIPENMQFNYANPDHWWGLTKGLYGTYALGSGLLGGALAYNHFRGTDPGRLVDKAIKQRQRERMDSQPVEITATPVMV